MNNKKIWKECSYKKRKSCNGCRLHRKCVLRKLAWKVGHKKYKLISAMQVHPIPTIIVFSLIAIIITVVVIRTSTVQQTLLTPEERKMLTKQNAESITEELAETEESAQQSAPIISRLKPGKLVPGEADRAPKRTRTQELAEEQGEELEATATVEHTGTTVEEIATELAVVGAEAKVSAYGPSDSYYYWVSEEERKTMEKVVFAEAGGEPLEGQVAVAAVVLNRLYRDNSYFDQRSINTIIYQPEQFAPRTRYITQADLDLAPSCAEAVDMALRGWDPTRVKFPKGAIGFYNPEKVTGYQAAIRKNLDVLPIGHHNFHEEIR